MNKSPKRIYVWQWLPDKRYTVLIGADVVMRNSLSARFLRDNSPLFTSRTESVEVECNYMNREQKLAFMQLHATRLNYQFTNPEKYIGLVHNVESLEYAICLDEAKIDPDQPERFYTAKQTLIDTWRTRNGFPKEIIALLSVKI